MVQRLTLPRVSLLAADTENPILAARAIQCCLDHCDFFDAALLTDVDVPAPCRIAKIPKIQGFRDYSRYAITEFANYVSSDFALIVQWDGFVVSPRRWNQRFLKFDYIGARWPGCSDNMSVGNGGFSLRSRKLLDALASIDISTLKPEAEDLLICRTLRPTLENCYGIKFAPDPIADEFSYENIIPTVPSFGFHCLRNLWRHINDRDMIEMNQLFNSRIVTSFDFVFLLLRYVSQLKLDVVCEMFLRLCDLLGENAVFDHLKKMVRNDVIASNAYKTCLGSVPLHDEFLHH